MAETNKIYTACMIIIGNEILSGRTQDANLAYLAQKLNDWGVRMMEARVIPDIEQTIIDTVNECRSKFDYVFTTGGIGPTHDDITAESVAKAFGVKLVKHEETFRRMAESYSGRGDFNEARQKMAYLPEGARPIENNVSIAPGFEIGNVFVMAGVPSIMRAMLDTLKNRLVGGQPVLSRTVNAHLGEGVVAQKLNALQERYPDLDMGSYPFYREGKFGTSLVLRGTDGRMLDEARDAVCAMIEELGGTPLPEED